MILSIPDSVCCGSRLKNSEIAAKRRKPCKEGAESKHWPHFSISDLFRILDFGFRISWRLGFGCAGLLPLLAAVGWLVSVASAWAAPDHSPWENSLITIEVTHNVYDFLQPWSLHTEEHRKTGVVVGPRQVLTTADHMASRTLVRAQKGGRGRWYTAEVQWIDYHANLAFVTISDTNFWQGLNPVALVTPAPTKGSVEVMRWRDGGLESRKGDVNRVTVKRGKLTFIDHLQMEITCEIKDAGWSEVVALGKRLVGLVVYHEENVLTVIPASFIAHILE